MNVQVTQLGAESATVRCVGDYDGVNPPDVFEFSVYRRSAPHNAERRFILEWRVGTSVEFAEFEENVDLDPEDRKIIHPLAELRDCWNATRGCLESIDPTFDPEKL